MSLATDKISGYLTAYERGDHEGSSKPSNTTQEVSDLLLRSHYSANGQGVTDHAATLTYSFPVYTDSDKQGAIQLNESQQAQTKLSLQSWSDVANITFSEVKGDDAKSADIKFGFYKAASGGNYTSYESTQNDLKSSVWISGNPGYDASTPQENNYARYTLTHEIGHALGLAHPGNYDASNATYPTYANSAKYYEDDFQYSLMSYFSEQNTGADYKGVWSSGPQLDDVTAIQKLYGANTTTRTGDTTYGFNSNTDRDFLSVSASTDKIVATLWDAGGNDTLDFSGYNQDQRININEGSFSDVGGLKANIAIAYGAQIENIIGGSGADILVGNALDNTLKGGAGNDIIYGSGGADQLWGNEGADTFVFRDAGDSQASAPDWIRDFQTAVDKIDLSWINQTVKAEGGELHFVDNLSGSLYEAALNYDSQQNVTDLAINLSGHNQPDFLVKIVGQVDAAVDIVV